MHLIYIDDSKDGKHLAFSALCVPADQWQASLQHLIEVRRALKRHEGIYTSVEQHATDWIGGRGRIAKHIVPKGARARLFDYMLSSIVMMPGSLLLNAFGRMSDEWTLFERMLNRINVFVTKAGSNALLISDEGKSYDALLRRMRRFNYIPSRYGFWADGTTARNIPAARILEDLVYRDSRRSYFVQAADFCAFSLLRFEVPTSSTTRLGISQSFTILEPICVKRAFSGDPRKLGIIRAT